MLSRERRLATLALVCAAAATPVLFPLVGDWAWLWGAAVAGLIFTYLLLLAVSFIVVRNRMVRDEESRALEARLASRDEVRSQASSLVADAERRIGAVIDDRVANEGQRLDAALGQIFRMGSDRIEAVRHDMEARRKDFEATSKARADALSSSVQELARGQGDQARRLDGLGDKLDRDLAATRSGLEEGLEKSRAEYRSAQAELSASVAASLADQQRRQQEFARSALEEALEASRAEYRSAQAELSASVAASLADQQREHRALQDALMTSIAEQRGEQTGAIAQLTRLMSDRIDVSRRDFEARLAAHSSELSALKSEQARREQDAKALTQETARVLESRLLEGLEAVRAEQAGRIDQLEAAVASALEERSAEFSQSLTYVRKLIDRRIEAGAAVIRDELNELRDVVATSIRDDGDAKAKAVETVRSAVTELTERVEAAESTRASTSTALREQADALAAVEQKAQAQIASLKSSLADQAAEQDRKVQAALQAAQSIEAVVRAEGPRMDQLLADLRALLERRMGPEFEERLDAWRGRLDNEIVSAVNQGRFEDQSAARVRETKLRDELNALHDLIRKQTADVPSRTDLTAAVTEQAEKTAQVEQQVQERLAALGKSVKSQADQLAAALEKVGAPPQPPAELAKIEKALADVSASSSTSANALKKMSDSNAALARPFDRLLSADKIQRMEQHWLKAFGVNMTRTALAYMAHKICLLEDRGMGRIAAPIETIVMRQLALRSLPNRGKLEVMEIGTLFGLGAAVLYNFRGSRAAGMHLTLVDPLEGYYEAGGADPVTGVEVSEAILRKNLADLDVPETDYRLIKALSADPQAIRPASDRLYDLILVDGDHSTAGVAADFENYGPLVKPGGLMIFDDYGSEHWPGIQPYVDETVRTDPNWIWIGADYRTAVVAKKADGATAKVSPPAAAKPAGARSSATRR